MKRHILLLRLSYWTAAIADFGIAVIALIPARMGVTELVYPMGLTSVIAFSWAVLLLIADRKPMERRWILIPTIIVVSLIIMTRTLFIFNETIEFSPALLVFAIALIMLMIYSYYCANQFEANE